MGFQLAGKGFKQCRFAASVGTYERHYSAGHYIQPDTGDQVGIITDSQVIRMKYSVLLHISPHSFFSPASSG